VRVSLRASLAVRRDMTSPRAMPALSFCPPAGEVQQWEIGYNGGDVLLLSPGRRQLYRRTEITIHHASRFAPLTIPRSLGAVECSR